MFFTLVEQIRKSPPPTMNDEWDDRHYHPTVMPKGLDMWRSKYNFRTVWQ